MIRRFLDWVHWLLIRRCKHDGSEVAADILEGAAMHAPERPGDYEVKWCRMCGAYRTTYMREFRQPRPDWRE
jgi:hypothetical protein